MTSAAEHLDHEADAADPPRRRRRLERMAAVAILAVMLVVGLGLVFPRTVPRLSVFPAPPSSGIIYEECNGRTVEKGTERWERTGPIWTLTSFRNAAGCIP